jgi:2,3-dimethylmalate lyase
MPKLREVLNARPKDRVIAAPGVYDMVSLRMAAAMDFEALYMTGYGAVASLLGSPTPGSPVMPTLVGRVRGAHALRGALGAVLCRQPARAHCMSCPR